MLQDRRPQHIDAFAEGAGQFDRKGIGSPRTQFLGGLRGSLPRGVDCFAAERLESGEENHGSSLGEGTDACCSRTRVVAQHQGCG